jgi:GSCFA family
MSMTPCPYKELPDSAFWKRSVAEPLWTTVDPVLSAPFKITQTMRVATAGSCFAQHIARHLKNSGYNYYVRERAPRCIHPEVALHYNYGTFSARFGNVYTTRQLRQLIDRALNLFIPEEPFWFKDGGYVDPFRPQIQPVPFSSIREAELDRASHLKAVRHMLESMDVFVFTLGLTESWESLSDGSVFPVCPGCGAGTFDSSLYQFKNFTYEEILDDLIYVTNTIRALNPSCRFIFTVSPVPLIATADLNHVLTATTYSKAVLRVAAETAVKQTPMSVYFPSFEIVSGAHTRGRYFEQDLRGIREEGVEHVMGVFFRHFTDRQPETADAQRSQKCLSDFQFTPTSNSMDVVCDEEILDKF